MRVSRAGLLVAIAILVPILVELRTVLAYFDIQLSVAETILLGAVAIGALLAWAMLPENDSRKEANGE